MLKLNLILQIKYDTDHYLNEKIQKVNGLMKDELGGKLMAGIAALRPKTYSYLRDHDDEKKYTKKRVMERKYKLF